MKKKNLTISGIESLLDKLPDNDIKLLYDESFAERIYQDYLRCILHDKLSYESLSNALKDKRILLIGPGNNAYLEKDKILDFIDNNELITICVNYIPDYIDVDYLFVSKSNRYVDLENKLNNINSNLKIIATSNLSERNKKFDYILDRKPLLEESEKINDNAFIMLIKALIKANVHHVFCAGFDGYSLTTKNFFNSDMEYDFIRDMTEYLNNHIIDMITRFKNEITIEFITTSKYDQKEDFLSGNY